MRKEKRYRSNLTKGIWIVIAHIAVVAAALCMGIFLAGYASGVRLDDVGKSYMQSQGFADRMNDRVYRIMKIITAQQIEKDLKNANPMAVIDLQEFKQNGENSRCLSQLSMKNTSGLAYSVQDLLEWEEHWDGEYSYDEDPLLRCETYDGSSDYFYLSEFKKLAADNKLEIEFNRDFWIIDEQYENDPGFLALSVSAKFDEILEQLDMNGYYDMESIGTVTDTRTDITYERCYVTAVEDRMEEKAAPQGAESLLDAVNISSVWKGKVSEAYEELYKVLSCIREVKDSQSIYDYSGLFTLSEQESSNLAYLFADKETGEIYTNKKAYKSYAQLEQNLKKIQEGNAYVVIYPQIENCVTNIPEMNILHTAQDCLISKDYVFAVGIDTAYPVSDILAEEAHDYETYANRMLPSLCGSVISVVFILISVIWLTAAAGRYPEDEKLHLNLFDTWYTEIAAAIVISAEIAGVAVICFGSTQMIEDTFYQLLLIAMVGGAYTMTWFLTGYLSLVRRIKAGILWKNSLLRLILRWIAKCFHKCGKTISGFVEIFSRNTSSKLKMLVMGGCFLIVQFFLSGLVLSGDAEFFFFLFGVDVAVMIYLLRKADGRDLLLDGVKRISDGEIQYKIPLEKLTGSDKRMAEYINNIGSGLDAAVENSLKKERMQTELITNVSHDLKTPLTSIINYVDLLKRENIQDQKIQGYLKILDEKSQRLKVLTEDVVEASKASTGNIKFEMNDLDFVEMVQQVIGEFQEKFQEKNLTMMVHFADEPSVIYADGQRMWRVLENIFGNVVKYAMEGTRVYAEIKNKDKKVIFSLKNISAQPLNFSADELTERFIRGDVARNTEGSGLGLSIAKSLTQLQGGEFNLYLDGDLFKVVITFAAKQDMSKETDK